MYDPKFEKGVRQKMEELQFAPSESVWAHIEKAVTDGHRRRRGFYFWRIAFSGAVLAGIVTVLYHAPQPAATPQTKIASQAKVTPKTVASPAATQESAANPQVSTSTPRESASTQQASAKAAPPSVPAAGAASPGDLAMDPASQREAGTRSRSKGHSVTGSKEGTGQDKDVAQNDRTGEFADANQRLSAGTQTSVKAPANAPATANAPASRIAPYLYQPPLAGQGSAAAIKAAKVSAKTNTVALSKLEKTKRPWEAGFVAGGGMSRLNHLNLANDAASQNSASLYSMVSNTATSAAAAAPSKRYVSDVRPDLSFMAGIHLQKGLSNRWTLNLGMNLHYYSTRISIGQPVNTYVSAMVSLISPTVAPSAQSATAYVAGDKQKFTNHYYFLEVPVSMQFQLNKSHMLPIFIEGGFSLARLMGSDALFYDVHTGVYYKDPSVLQKTQFSVNSALMVGLPFHGIKLEVGPQVQYGLTPLINDKSQGDQHFLYAGLKVVIIPGKK